MRQEITDANDGLSRHPDPRRVPSFNGRSPIAPTADMPFIRRSLATLTGLLLLQLMLLGSGTVCAMHDGAVSTRASHAMHQMPGMSGGTGSHQVVIAAAEQSNDSTNPTNCGSGRSGGCDLPFPPGQCASMTACHLSANPTSVWVATSMARSLSLALPSPAAGHAGPSFAPELPPPRA